MRIPTAAARRSGPWAGGCGGVEDKERVAATAADKSSSSHAPRIMGTTAGTHSVRDDAAPPSRVPPLLHIRHPRPRTLPLPHMPTQMGRTTKRTTPPRPTQASGPLSSTPRSTPLAFPGPHPSSPSYNSSGTLAESAAIGFLAYNSESSRGGRHSTTHSQAGSHASSASSSSYAGYASFFTNTSTSKRNGGPSAIPAPSAGARTRGGVHVEDEPELFGECFGEGGRTEEDLLGTWTYFFLFCDGEDGEHPAHALCILGFLPRRICNLPSSRPLLPLSRHAHALHARLLSWSLDAPPAPSGVVRMALASKAAGEDVGMWFGSSAAAGR
ncbi:hypothetical protein B0H10DRAFT_2225788 [Mycena sp. CBHHK59/15]|nr:hypothetical protein B0H10DRAFT_2225788 [Mycena sp. CBHHK59/15]